MSEMQPLGDPQSPPSKRRSRLGKAALAVAAGLAKGVNRTRVVAVYTAYEIKLQDGILRHALELQRLSAHEEAQATAILQQLDGELRTLLASRALSEAGKREINALINQAEEAIQSGYAEVATSVDTHGLMLVVAQNTVKALETVIPSVAIPTAETLASLTKAVLIDGAPSAAWWSRQAEDTAFRFASAVRQGVVNGETNERIVARVAGRDGFMETSRRNARALVHSSIMTAANDARMATYKKNMAHADGIRWLATLDSHTCIRCAVLDGVMWDFDGNPIRGSKTPFRGLPPLHFSCRCVVSILPRSLDKLLGLTGIDAEIAAQSRRASKDGPVANTSFDEFLSRQSPEFVDEMLGKQRAELYRAGKITLSDLVSGTGRELTLDELKARI